MFVCFEFEKNQFAQNRVGNVRQAHTIKRHLTTQQQMGSDLTNSIQTMAMKYKCEDMNTRGSSFDDSGCIWSFNPIEMSLGFWDHKSMSNFVLKSHPLHIFTTNCC